MIKELHKMINELDSGIDIKVVELAILHATQNTEIKSAQETFKIFCEEYARLTNDSAITIDDVIHHIDFYWRDISKRIIHAKNQMEVEQIMFEYLVQGALFRLSFCSYVDYNQKAFIKAFMNGEHGTMIEKFQKRFPSLSA